MKLVKEHVFRSAAIAVLWTCFAAPVQSQQSTTRSLTAALPSLKISAKVDVLKGAPCPYDISSYGWGAENSCPLEIVHSVIVDQSGVRQIIPLSAFGDLAAPRTVKLIGHSPKSFTLVIAGGDAATAYVAYLKFNGVALVSRKVQSGEFPLEANETTTYRFNLGAR